MPVASKSRASIYDVAMAEIGLRVKCVPSCAMESAREPDEVDLPTCPICEGNLHLVYHRYHQKVVVCSDCNTGITIPGSAWTISRLKREGNWTKKIG
jgi:hypothetical protein